MNKKKALRKLVLAEILSSKSRFLSILLLILIGVAFFSGLNASGPDMLKTAELYFDNQNLMDLRLVSTMGLEDEDIQILSSQPNIDRIEMGYSQDVSTDKELLFKIFSYDKDHVINQFVADSGRLPETSGEIALIDSTKIKKQYQIGDTVTFVPDGKNSNHTNNFKRTSYQVVGFVKTPLYLSDKNIGSSPVGKGSLDGYGVIGVEDFDLSVYTDAYITLQNLSDLSPYSEAYREEISKYQDEIKLAFKDRGPDRYKSIKEEAEKKLKDAKEEVADGKKQLVDGQNELNDAKAQIEDGKQQLADGEKELQDAKKEIDKGYQEYTKNKADFDSQISSAQAQLVEGANQINEAQNKVKSGYESIDQGNQQLSDGLNEIAQKEKELTAQKNQMNQYISQVQPVLSVPINFVSVEQQQELITSGKSIPLGNDQTMGDLWSGYFASQFSGDVINNALNGFLAQIENGLSALTNTKAQLIAKQQELSDAKSQIDSNTIILNSSAIDLEEKTKEFESGKAEGEKKLADAKLQLEAGERKYQEGITALEKAKVKLADGEKEYAEGLTTYKKEKADAAIKIADAEEQITDGEEALADLKEPSYYVLTREDNPHYTEFKDDAQNLSSLSMIFPSFFFAIAALVCLTTITRMIEEQRVQIGTMKALGYTTGEISLKYYVYALSASMIGALLGLVVGFNVIPRIVFGAYSILYDIPNHQYIPYLSFSLISVGIALFCTGFSARAVLHQELKSTPSVLMRPKSPKMGKRIFLERISLLWNHLNFNQKVSMRNLFRYKQRMLMTVFGIAGCMGLMVTGFGLNDSISDISNFQYKDIIQYQALVVFDEDADQKALEQVKKEVSEYDGIQSSLIIHEAQYDVKKSGVNTQQALLIVPEDITQINDFVTLRDRKSKEIYALPKDGAIISEKLATLFGVSVGDLIRLADTDNQVFEIKVAGITENYAGHFIYMSPEYYQSAFQTSNISYNGALLQYVHDTDWENNLSITLNEYDAIKAISYNSSSISVFHDSMGSLNAVVLVLIISAAILAFVVLYNLTNINVSERIRELSTIKVLGFYDKEVTMYIYRENLILSLIGIASGSFLGIFLHRFVLDTAAMDNIMFSPTLHLHSYLYAGMLTLVFSALVMWVMHMKLKHVDMIEALKSNE